MTTQLSQLAVQRFVDNNGNALAGGQLYTYQAGTSTPAATYTDSTGVTPNSNPVILNARGEANVWTTGGLAYKFVLKDASGNLIWSVDNITDGSLSSSLAAALASTTDPTKGSALVGYLPGETDALGRTLESKLREIISAVDEGALGGSIDDTAAIQRLVTASATKLAIINTASRISASINIPANARIIFAPGASLIPTARFSGSLSAIGVDDWEIENPVISGLAATPTDSGIYVDGCKNWKITRPTISNLGIVNTGAITTDSATGAMGIQVTCISNNTSNGVILGPRISNIAGGGNTRGDGISIAGSYVNTLYSTSDVKVINPEISTVARSGISVEGPSNNIPYDVKIENPTISKTSLAGINFEDAVNTSVTGKIRFNNCGNDQTFYNPAVVYGSTYGLMSAFNTQNALSTGCSLIGDAIANGCYYGLSTGVSDSLIIDGLVCLNSVVADWLGNSLAQSATNLEIRNCKFQSAVGSTLLYRAANLTVGGLKLKNNYFSSLLTVGAYANIRINQGNTFANGLVVQFAASVAPEIDDNIFLDFAGNQLTIGTTNDGLPNPKVRRNTFRFTSAALSNIRGADASFTGAVIEGNTFQGATVANVYVDFTQTAITTFSGNYCSNAPYGIYFKGGAVAPNITNNMFTGISTYCINFNEVFSPLVLNGANISNNNAVSGCVGGLRILVDTGTWNFVNILGNNWAGCSGTHQSISGAGNAGGFVANNT